ncbi:MAG: outer membrane beta-barrel protein [Verrucomicrobiota bacterium]
MLTSLSATTLSGYVDTSAIWNMGTGNANMPGRVYDGPTMMDGFNLDVVSLTLDKPLDDSQWASGYHFQMLMGPGAAQRGTGIFASSGTTDFAFNEAYVNLRVPIGNGLELHMGQFGTFNGYESYDTYKDPNFSRSYGFYIESSAHTGIAGTYKVTDCFALQAGIGNQAGYNNQVDVKNGVESKKAYLVMASFTAPESFGFMKGATLSAGWTDGGHFPAVIPNVSGGGASSGGTDYNQRNLYIGGTTPLPITGLSLGVAYDLTTSSVFQNSYANALGTYLMWQITEKLKSGSRLDFGWGSNGSYANGENGSFGYVSQGSCNQLMSLTETLDYSLWKNVISRVEFRWDHCLTDDKPFGGTVAADFSTTPATPGNPSKANAETLTLNIIYMF